MSFRPATRQASCLWSTHCRLAFSNRPRNTLSNKSAMWVWPILFGRQFANEGRAGRCTSSRHTLLALSAYTARWWTVASCPRCPRSSRPCGSTTGIKPSNSIPTSSCSVRHPRIGLLQPTARRRVTPSSSRIENPQKIGEGGIRTPGTRNAHWFSKPAPSAARAPLLPFLAGRPDGLSRTAPATASWASPVSFRVTVHG